MQNERCIVLIPARMESSRLNGKPMKKIAGIPMIIHVAIRSSQCPIVKRTIVCTDSAEIICKFQWGFLNHCERCYNSRIRGGGEGGMLHMKMWCLL